MLAMRWSLAAEQFGRIIELDYVCWLAVTSKIRYNVLVARSQLEPWWHSHFVMVSHVSVGHTDTGSFVKSRSNVTACSIHVFKQYQCPCCFHTKKQRLLWSLWRQCILALWHPLLQETHARSDLLISWCLSQAKVLESRIILSNTIPMKFLQWLVSVV